MCGSVCGWVCDCFHEKKKNAADSVGRKSKAEVLVHKLGHNEILKGIVSALSNSFQIGNAKQDNLSQNQKWRLVTDAES